MPYFKWYALDEQGAIRTGSSFARSQEALAKLIKKQACTTLLACKEHKKRVFSPVSYAERALFFKQMGSLLQADIPVSDALLIAEQTVTNGHFKQVIADCTLAVQEGIALSEACAFHIDFFTPFACRLLMAGEESGALDTSCLELANYYTNVDLFMSKVKSVLLLPAITAAFFVLIVVAMFWMVIPRFAILLRSLNKPLPWRTQKLIEISDWLTSLHIVHIVGFLALTALLLRFLLLRFRKTAQRGLLLYTPFFRWWVYSSATVSFFKTLGSLLMGGVDIAKALHIACLSVAYAPLRMRYEKCAQAVESGKPLSVALQATNIPLDAHCTALILVGEATGKLGPMLIECATYYQNKLYKMLDTFSKIIQPLVLLLLGLCVGCLVFIIYEPIFTLSMITA